METVLEFPEKTHKIAFREVKYTSRTANSAGSELVFVRISGDTGFVGETGLYYYGARYLDPRTSRWLSADPAVGEYIPVAPINDEARERNGNLPGMGGVFNYVNLHVYHYAGNNPVKYLDPDGSSLKDIISGAKDIYSLIKSAQNATSITSGIISALLTTAGLMAGAMNFMGIGGTIAIGLSAGLLTYILVDSGLVKNIMEWGKGIWNDVWSSIAEWLDKNHLSIEGEQMEFQMGDDVSVGGGTDKIFVKKEFSNHKGNEQPEGSSPPAEGPPNTESKPWLPKWEEAASGN
jgi:RHS repeat-associated protein